MENLRNMQCFVFDMDGTINLGNTLIDGALELIETLRQQGKAFYFFTNNSSKSPEEYVQKLTSLGFGGITREHIMTSGDVTIHYLLSEIAQKPKVYLAGTPALEKQFIAAGIELLPPSAADADAVVLGFDTTFNFEKADAICRFVTAGAPLLATNIDNVCPLEGGAFLPDCGSMCKMITHATGIEPKFLGKPFPETVDYILDKTGCPKEQMAIVGDRLYTDIATAIAGGITGIAVLSGEVTQADIENSETIKPTYVVNSVLDIYNAIKD